MKVLIIPEDFRYDQYILKPIFNRLFKSIFNRNVKVRVCTDPLLMGVDQALSLGRLREIIDQYPMHDLFILCVDRDCMENRRNRLEQIEHEFGSRFLAVDAWEEIETWALAGLSLPNSWRWTDVRGECHVKEHYFEPFARMRGASDGPGGGRKALGDEASRNIHAIRQKCLEDFDNLAQRLNALI